MYDTNKSDFIAPPPLGENHFKKFIVFDKKY